MEEKSSSSWWWPNTLGMSLYILFKAKIRFNKKIKSFVIHNLQQFPTEARTYVVFCDYFKIFFGSTDFKCSWYKHKVKLFVFKCAIIVLYFWRSKFSFVFKSWTHKNCFSGGYTETCQKYSVSDFFTIYFM
jgi:hypothetical protein